jgi:antitoxin (DNA-binding transcriptional repressor) of toxin-antitoxin stability system
MLSVAEAQEQLPDLIARALRGERIVITHDGQPVVELRPVQPQPPARPVTAADIAWLKAGRIRARGPLGDAGALVSDMRDEEER